MLFPSEIHFIFNYEKQSKGEDYLSQTHHIVSGVNYKIRIRSFTFQQARYIINMACFRMKNKGSIYFGTVWYKGTDR